MKKKILSVLLAATMGISVLAGCGGSTDGGNSDSTEGSITTEYGTYTPDNPYHLTFAYVEFYEQDNAARQAVQDAMNDILREELCMEVEFLPLAYADYQTTIQLMLSGGDALDVMPIYVAYAPSWINMGGVYDMNDFADTTEYAEIVEALGADQALVSQMNGILFGFPANKESVELGGLFMRKDICDELGITEEYGLEDDKDEYDGNALPWSEAENIFAKVKEAYPNMTPFYMYNPSQINRFVFHDYLADNFGVLDWESDHDTTTVVNQYETESYIETVKMLADWYDKGYIYQDAATDTQGSATMMKAGNTFSYATAIKPGFLAEAEAANGCEGYALYFGPNKEGGNSTSNISFFNTGIANNSEDPEMAFKFVHKLYTDPEIINLFLYGIKDVNYTVLEDGTAYYVDGENDGNYAYHQNTGWAIGNQFIGYVWNDGTKDADYWKKLKAHNDWSAYSKATGFMWDSGDYSTQITALNNALNTYRAALETGSVGSANVDSTLKALNDALYAAGLQEVIDEKQAQLDAWLAEQ